MRTQWAHTAQATLIGLQITGIERGTPLEKLGLKRGDILVSIDGQRIRSWADLDSTHSGRAADAPTLRLAIDRRGLLIQVEVDCRDPGFRQAGAER